MAARSMFREMDSDPFFTGYQDHFRQMEGMLDHPFGRLSLEDGRGRRDDGGRRDEGGRRRGEGGANKELSPFGDFGFGNMFGNMNSMMKDMEKAFTSAQSADGNGASFSQASFYSYSKNGKDGQPKIYQASKSTRSGPGGVRETRKALKDSERDLEKMGVGHHIYDRGHEVERHKNTRTGQTEEIQNYHKIGEDEAEAFDREWQEKTKQAFRGLDYGTRDRQYDGRRDDRRAMPAQNDKMKALPAPESEHWGRSSDSGRRRREKF